MNAALAIAGLFQQTRSVVSNISNKAPVHGKTYALYGVTEPSEMKCPLCLTGNRSAEKRQDLVAHAPSVLLKAPG